MKILIATEKPDMFFHTLIESLNRLDMPIAHAQFPFKLEDIDPFGPDLIIHNCEQFAKIDYQNAINIAVNETGQPNTFSLRNPKSPNFIKPFVKLSKESLYDPKYSTDVVYVGNPSMLPDNISKIQQDDEINFKILHNQAVPTTNCC